MFPPTPMPIRPRCPGCSQPETCGAASHLLSGQSAKGVKRRTRSINSSGVSFSCRDDLQVSSEADVLTLAENAKETATAGIENSAGRARNVVMPGLMSRPRCGGVLSALRILCGLRGLSGAPTLRRGCGGFFFCWIHTRGEPRREQKHLD